MEAGPAYPQQQLTTAYLDAKLENQLFSTKKTETIH